MVHIAVVDDEPRARALYEDYLRRYEKESGESIRISSFSDGDEIVEKYKAEYDIILMDIEMHFMDGLKAATKIRELDEEVVIIFMTNMPQYAMEGYRVDAMDYVLKPITYFSFTQRIDRAIMRMKKRRKQEEAWIMVPLKSGILKLRTSDIYYVEVRNHDLIYYTADASYETKGSMREVEEKLGDEKFFRCNKCYLINLEHVVWMDNSIAKVGPYEVQVSRAKRKEMMEKMNRYLSEVSK